MTARVGMTMRTVAWRMRPTRARRSGSLSWNRTSWYPAMTRSALALPCNVNRSAWVPTIRTMASARSQTLDSMSRQATREPAQEGSHVGHGVREPACGRVPASPRRPSSSGSPTRSRSRSPTGVTCHAAGSCPSRASRRMETST